VLTFATMLSRLQQRYGEVEPPPAHGPFALVLWENACYLLPDTRRQEVFAALEQQVGMNAAAVDAASSCDIPHAPARLKRPQGQHRH
jgi:endonuclease-3